MRDKVHSYNGYLSFTVQSTGGQDTFPDQILKTYPLVSLQGNWQFVLEYYPKEIAKDGKYKVRLHEDHWRLKNNPKKVSREMMMVALQNIQYILIRATDAADAKTALLSDVTLDVATEGSPVSSRIAVGVEQCICPGNYTGNSCQDPNVGFYRWYKKNYVESTIIIDLIGESRPCDCNGRSEKCDPETGECMNCRENTAGAHCEVCATGYFGDPAIRKCKPCACPTRKQNFAETCQADRYAEYICNCKKGYTGDKCDRCDYGYYGKPTVPGGSCVQCDCDPFGSVHEGCDQNGQCTCKPGITGRDCSQCAPRHVTSEQGCISCEDGCVDVLLDEIEELIRRVTSHGLDGFIPVPWPALREIQNLTSILRSQLNKYHSHVDVSQNMVVNFDLDYYAKDLLKRAKRLEVSAMETYPPTAKINEEAQSLFDLLTESYASIEDTVAYLKNYAIGETPSISIGAALEEAKKILKEIEMKNFTRFDVDAELELTRSISLFERINGMLITDDQIDGLRDRIKRIQGNLNDILQRVTNANTQTIEARELNEENSARLARLKEHSTSIKNYNLMIDNQNFNATRFVREARGHFNTTKYNFKDLEGMLTTLRNHSSVLKVYEKKLSRKNEEYRDKYVKKASDHAMDLMRESIRLESIFNETRDVADGPIRAAKAYQRIVDALLSAEKAAKNASIAANAAYEKAYPGDIEESLLHRAKQSLRQSNDLFNKGDGFRRTVVGLATSLGDHRKALGSARDAMDNTKERLNTLNRIIDTHMAANLSSEIESTNERIDSIHTNVGNTQNFVNAIYTNLTIIKKQAQDLNKFDTSLLNDIREKITAAEGHTMKGVRLGNNLMKTKDRIQNRSNDLRERIEALKRKIQQTRQYASSIRVSLTTDAEGVCVRKYRPQLQPSTTTKIVLSYAINTAEKNALLLYLGSQNTSDFMAVEMVNRRIHFTWDSGGGEKRIQHLLKLQTNTPGVSDDTRWYHISISRIGTVGHLNVQPANSDGLMFDNSPVTGASQPGFSKMDLLPSDTLWIGGSPEVAATRLKTSSFAGCLHTVSIDGENVGLWNFTESQGCDACNEGERLLVRQEDERSVGFNGKGYFKGTNRIRRPKQYYSVVLAFKTLDEDALLFLAVNNEKNQYFSISLEDGHIVFTCQFDAQTRLTMRSSERLNNRKGVTQIQATVQNRQSGGSRMGRLVVGEQDQLGTVKGGPDLDLSYVPYYFGGVDPEFDKNRWGGKLVLRSFLGCMSEFSVLDEGKNPLTDGQNYGITRACTEKALSDVGFLGQGYIELPSAILKRESNFGFTFQTMEANALLMVSTFVGQDDERETTTTTTTPPLAPGEVHPPDFYSVALVEGHLEIHLNGGAGMVAIMSKEKYNEGLLHSFFVIKENRKVTLKVDDIEVNSTRLERGNQVVEAPNEGGLYFGGVPPDLDVGRMVGSTRPLKGCIRDVIVNDKHISFSRPVRLRDVYIGRCADLPRRAMQGMEGDMKAIDSCQAPTQHTVEYKALKFGDQLNSHVMVPLEKNTFKKNYNISFEFRTYYPNGLFFIASHTRKKQTQAISAQLLNGRVVVMIKRRKKIYKMSSGPGLNNGKWRKVIVEKERKSLRLIIDNNLIEKTSAPRKLNIGRELFIGGRLKSAPKIEGVQVTETLRGCLRNYNINGEEYEIPSVRRKDRIVGVGQCFASVQLGSYFPGDAYAIYSNDFNVGPILELRLEFRTWELNGILLSVADKRGTGFSLELVNGAVVASVNMGVDHSFSARVILRNRFTLCDNTWHTVDVNYVKDSITLRVDKYPETYGFNGVNNIIGTPTSAPLYVGGLPESELQGTLTTRENFKGCIRNIVLNSERKDWTDMYHLQNVLLNACPVQ